MVFTVWVLNHIEKLKKNEITPNDRKLNQESGFRPIIFYQNITPKKHIENSFGIRFQNLTRKRLKGQMWQ